MKRKLRQDKEGKEENCGGSLFAIIKEGLSNKKY